ncbi:surfeit locus protein 6-domain-containing protein [Pseudomassariella vexata]|uniref:Surfeit locus protein 6-domain-containing protein n=1 Tax=Pseudomassariella vexata TaxID=1141098 RepID=A0A1Y2E9C6_9PEZI|nr:surfeit locus protein 6-domain-containing protein [Pseudomassariella vexata]ORY68178.1 surfeit locus protein 6-domain-containing protein [Pseudomassariella vexata]
MAESSLQDRLRDHAKAFDGLLSLIPAKMYYGEDSGDQWQKKKQSKAQAKEARRNKLDPDSELNRNVKEVMDEQEGRKRKREQRIEDGEDEPWSDVEGIEAEKPGQGLKKKQKLVEVVPEMTEEEKRKEEKKAARKERKAERKELREEEAAYAKRNVKSGVNKVKLGPREIKPATSTASKHSQSYATDETKESVEDEPEADEPSDVNELDISGLAANDDGDDAPGSDSESPSEPASPVFDPNGTPADSTGQAESSTTSISSTTPASDNAKPAKKSAADTEALRERLAAKIKALREARKADGPDGKPIRTRQELIESRRQKQAERKAHKREQRERAKEEEDQRREEALASARNSPLSILSPSVDSPDNNFAFGRVAFGDGTQLAHDLSHVLSSGKKKGPSDPKTALQKLQNEKKRLEQMGDEKRKDIEEKETWLVARKRAEGEKIRDDEKLLKKALKRKEGAKKKSEKAWAERAEGVQKSIHQRQKKRETNIKQRKEQKLSGKAGKKKKPAGKKGKGRAGFEGSFSVGGKGK